jgi:acyl-CoA synthetase (AMP-forming)/AMP-acid ligase II
MILGQISRASGITTTLDDLFRRAGVRHPDAPALADPPNRTSFTEGAPRTLSYAQVDHAISAVAARLRSSGLPTARRHDCRARAAALAPPRHG